MIITLKGADFSASNIGTLSSWRISRSLGSGATYEGVTSVDKDASFTATVTIAEGYELGTAGVTVTMGGTVISAATVNGNVITINIAEVTGNVVIKVPTVNLSTGEEEEPVVPDIPSIPEDGGAISAVWEQGALQNNSGETDSTTRIRTKFIDVTNVEHLTITFDHTMYAVAAYWYSSLNSNKSINTPGWESNGMTITPDTKQSNYLRIVAKKLNDSEFTPDEADGINVNIVTKSPNTEITTINWSQGSITGTTGETSDTTRIKTDFIHVENLISLTSVFDITVYNVAVYWYSDPALNALKNSPTYQAENLNITVANRINNYMRLVVKRVDGAAISLSETESIKVTMKFYKEGNN